MSGLLKHVQWLKDNQGSNLAQALKAEGLEIAVEKALEKMQQADPSRGKRAVDWLVKTYIAGGFLWEDIRAGEKSKVSETLQLFGKYRSRLVGEKRNLSSYGELADVWSAIASFVPAEISGREQKRKEKKQALEESRVLFRDENLVVAVPLTRFSAQWWGKGTRWCTSATYDNQFDHYNQHAPLIVLAFSSGIEDATSDVEKKAQSKFQLWFTEHGEQRSSSFSFMDAEDRAVNPKFVHEHWNIFSRVILWCLEKNRYAIKYIPEKIRTREMYLKGRIENIPEKYWTKEISDRVFKEYPYLISAIPKKFLTSKMWQEALTIDANLIYLIPPEFLTDEIVSLAVDINPMSWSDIPQTMLNAEHYSTVASHGVNPVSFPPEYRTFDNFLNSCKVGSNSIRSLPMDFFNEANFNLFLAEAPSSIRMLVREQIEVLCSFSSNTITQAIKISPSLFRKLPPEIITTGMVEAVIDNKLSLLYPLPTALLTPELYRRAVTADSSNLPMVPEQSLTQELYTLAVTNNGRALAHVPQESRSWEVCKLALENNLDALKWLPEAWKTRELCWRAFEEDASRIKIIPARHIDRKMAARAVAHDGLLIRYVPQEFLDDELCWKAVSADAHALSYLPDSFKTREMCWQAIANNSNSILAVPMEFFEIGDIEEMIRINKNTLEFLQENNLVPEGYLNQVYLFHDKYWAHLVARKWDIKILDQLQQVLEGKSTFEDNISENSLSAFPRI